MRRHLLSTAALALVVTVAVAGCDDSGSDGESDSGSSQSTSESPSTDSPATGSAGPSSSKAPKLPAAAKSADEAGAEAYVRYYVDVVNAAADTGDTEVLHAAVTKCSTCQQFPAIYDDMYNNGGWVDGGFYRVLDVQATMKDDETAQAVAKLKADTSTTFKTTKNNKKQRIEAASYVWTIDLEHSGDGWQITGMKEKF